MTITAKCKDLFKSEAEAVNGEVEILNGHVIKWLQKTLLNANVNYC